mgnify:CR=1 FL=1
MNDITILEEIQKLLQKNVADHIKLQKANDKDIFNYELVSPQIHIGWIPPKGFLPEGLDEGIPCIIIGHDEGNDDGRTADINIRLSFVVFSPGKHDTKDIDELKNYTPNFEGYRDLLNLMEKTKQEILRNQIINKAFVIQYPIKWGMYQEQPYPYWYGWITFSIRKQAYPPAAIAEKYL